MGRPGGRPVGSGVQGLVRGSVWSGSAVPFGSCGPCSLLIFAAAICVQLESELLRERRPFIFHSVLLKKQ